MIRPADVWATRGSSESGIKSMRPAIVNARRQAMANTPNRIICPCTPCRAGDKIIPHASDSTERNSTKCSEIVERTQGGPKRRERLVYDRNESVADSQLGV